MKLKSMIRGKVSIHEDLTSQNIFVQGIWMHSGHVGYVHFSEVFHIEINTWRIPDSNLVKFHVKT